MCDLPLGSSAWAGQNAAGMLCRLIPFIVLSLLAGMAHAQPAPPKTEEPAPAAAAGSAYSVGGINVDVQAANPQDARMAAFRIAQRKAWPQLWARLTGKLPADAPRLSDGQLDGIVSGIESQGERFSMTRYIARLAVVFDRSRVVDYFGGITSTLQSPPMLLLPVWVDGGSTVLFQQKTLWAEAWARYRENVTPIDYVVPAGTAADNVLLTGFQMRRPERSGWRTLLARFDAVDVLIAEARITRSWPGGPVRGRFLARHGPDAVALGQFDLVSETGEDLPSMLDTAVQRIDDIYAEALRNGRLQAEEGLAVDLEPVIAPALFIDAAPVAGSVVSEGLVSGTEVLVATPDAAAYASLEAALRRVPGITAVTATSLSLGGSSRLLISHMDSLPALRNSLGSQGFVLGEESPLPILRRRSVVAADAAPPPR